MRYARTRLTPGEETALHPLGKALAAEPSVTREAIHRLEVLADGSGVLLAEARGDGDRYRELLAESGGVHEFAVTVADGRLYAYAGFEPPRLTRELDARRHRSAVALEMPIEPEPDGSYLVTFVGNENAFGELLGRDLLGLDVESYEVEVLEVGQRPPDAEAFFACLTDRQQEILAAALEAGYYENPREATHADVAARVDATPSTVGEHLRKVESRVFGQFE